MIAQGLREQFSIQLKVRAVRQIFATSRRWGFCGRSNFAQEAQPALKFQTTEISTQTETFGYRNRMNIFKLVRGVNWNGTDIELKSNGIQVEVDFYHFYHWNCNKEKENKRGHAVTTK